MTKRIESLRKEKITEDMFRKKGLSPTLADIKVKVDDEDTGNDRFRKLIAAVMRKQRKTFFNLSLEQKHAFIQKISKGYKNIQVVPIRVAESEHGKLIVNSLKNKAKITGKTLEQVEAEYNPALLIIQSGDQEPVQAYTLLNANFPPSVHDTSWVFRSKDYPAFTIMDISRVLAEAVAVNETEKFARQNENLIKYLTTRYIAELSRDAEVTYLPLNPKFSTEVIQEMKKYEFLRENTKTYDFIDNCEAIFHLEKDSKGFVREIYHRNAMNIIVPEFLSQMNYAQESAKMEISARADYAKSFQTKKHINKQTQVRMEANAFLTHYEYTELDNEVDLKKFSILEKDFIQFTKRIAIPKAMDHSFRIKKLGHYRAAGVYFPYFKATIVDMDHPDAYAHELAHQMDYTLREDGKQVSEQSEFRPIVDLYRNAVTAAINNLPTDSPFKGSWGGSSKYNKQYYFQPTEIFARSFELYLTDMGIESSFLKKSYDSPVYPCDETYRKQIKQYFSSLFPVKPIVEEAPKPAKKKKVFVDVWEPVHYEQLSLL